MNAIRVHFSGSEESIAQLSQIADASAINHSGARDAGSNVEALNAPITGAEIILVAKVVSAVFTAGSAVVAFIVAVRAALVTDETISIKIGKRRLTLTKDTPDADIEKLTS